MNLNVKTSEAYRESINLKKLEICSFLLSCGESYKKNFHFFTYLLFIYVHMYIYLFCHFINEDIAQNVIAAMEVLHLTPTARIVIIFLYNV